MDVLPNNDQELAASYANERKLLKEKVASGVLKELPANNGTLYILSLDDNQEIPIALTMRDKDMVIHSGDFVVFKATPPSGLKEERITVGDLKVDGRGDIQFHQNSKPNNYIFKIEEATINISALIRLPKPKRAVTPAPNR